MGVTVLDVMNQLAVPQGKLTESVDELLAGNPLTEVTGIVVSFMPTLSVIERVIARGSNLIVTHEGLYFSHQHGERLYGDSEVCREKMRRIEEAGLAVYRCHDYWHIVKPDGVTEGLVQSLGWGQYVLERKRIATLVELPSTTLLEVAEHLKVRLGISYVRAMGDPNQQVRRVAVLSGYRGGGPEVIPLIERTSPDLVIYGEGPEWETPEYVRDARYLGHARSLLVIGHAESESPGMAALADRLRNVFPMLRVDFEPDAPLFYVV
jgi:putative NIF3 family GTP cyclohydrolase 1 type 2